MKNKIQFIFFLSILFVSCRAMLVSPDESDAMRAKNSGHQYDLDNLKQSHNLYINKCGGCHTLYLPSYKISGEWKSVIEEMASKAKIDSTEKEMILNYLIVMSEKPLDSKKKD
jgi:hypothetical protein